MIQHTVSTCHAFVVLTCDDQQPSVYVRYVFTFATHVVVFLFQYTVYEKWKGLATFEQEHFYPLRMMCGEARHSAERRSDMQVG